MEGNGMPACKMEMRRSKSGDGAKNGVAAVFIGADVLNGQYREIRPLRKVVRIGPPIAKIDDAKKV